MTEHSTPTSIRGQQAPSHVASQDASIAGGPTAPVTPRPVITTRRLAPSDSISHITKLLHRAYAKQIALGLSPLAGRQTDDITRQRLFNGEAWVAVHHVPVPDPLDPEGVLPTVDQKVVGTILYHEIEEAEGPPWFHRPDVAWFSQFAVDPDYQGQGLGQMLLQIVEDRAREEKAAELALSMAEPDTDLMNFYLKRGWRVVDYWQWPYTNYRSLIMSKKTENTEKR